MDHYALVKAALDYGADKAELIAPSRLVCSDRFRAYCEDNVCGFYGKCWSCPPDIGEINVLIAQLLVTFIPAISMCVPWLIFGPGA